MEEFAHRYTLGFDIFNSIFAGFAVFALLLASLGTYGVVAYSVGQRTHEIGVRLAVGAMPRSVVSMMALQGLRMSIVGLAIGAALLIPVVRLVGQILEGLSLAPVEPLTVVVVATVLFGASLAASVLPARRAARVDPVTVLKVE